MDFTPRSRLDLEALADAGQQLGGSFDAALLDARLAQALDRDQVAGEVRYDIDFKRLYNGEVGVSGVLQARLIGRCQRCLQDFELRIEAKPHVQLSTMAERAQAEEGWELGDTDPSPSLGKLIEDELLLALPFAPLHSATDCPAVDVVELGAREAETQRPFTDLARALRERDAKED